MKHKDVQALHDASITELTKKLKEFEKTLAELKRDKYTKQTKNVREMKNIRLAIARIKTIITVKELV